MTTTGTANGMAIRDWAFLACRALALYLFYQAVDRSLPAILIAFAFPTEGESPRILGYFYLVSFLLPFGGGLILWFGAARLAGWMVPRQAQEPAAAAAGERNVTRLLSLAVAVFGLVMVVFAIPEAIGLAATYLAGDRLDDSQLVAIALVAIRLVLGILLVFGGRGIANVIGRARGWPVG